MVDLHSHILPGLDDGVGGLDEAVELACEAVDAGVTAIAATPHVRDDYPTTARQMEDALLEVSGELRRRGVPLRLVTGAEVALDRLGRLDDEELRRLTYGGGGRYLLVEFPYSGWPRAAEVTLAGLAGRGVTAVLAHPERNDAVQEQPNRLQDLVASTGALVQVTVGSLAGGFGGPSKRAALALLRLGLAHLAASDVHRPGSGRRSWAVPPDIRPALAEWLTVTVPDAILSGLEIPPMPTARRRLEGLQRPFRR